MKITIQRSAENQALLTNKVWKLVASKYQVMLLAFMIFYAACFCIYHDPGQPEDIFWNTARAIFLALFTMCLTRFLILQQQKKRYFMLENRGSMVTIDANGLSLNKEDLSVHYDWSYFKFYQLKEGLVMLQRERKLYYCFTINLAELDAAEQDWLRQMIFSKGIIKI